VHEMVVCRARHMFLRVRIIYHNFDRLCKSQTQPGSGEECSGITTGYPAMVPGKAVALLRQGTANARGDEQKSSEAGLVGRVRNTGQSPLTTTGQTRILGARVRKDMCLPREARCASYESATETYRNIKGIRWNKTLASWMFRAVSLTSPTRW